MRKRDGEIVLITAAMGLGALYFFVLGIVYIFTSAGAGTILCWPIALVLGYAAWLFWND